MPRRPGLVRIVAILLSALLGLTGPGAALAHGVAHVREHRAADHAEADDHHAPHLLDRLAALVHAHDDDETDPTASVAMGASVASAVPGHPEPAVTATDDFAIREQAVARQTREDSHGHVRIDVQVISRLALDALLPAFPALAPATAIVVATTPTPPAASPLRLAQPPTGPPPPSRAPPAC